MTGIGFVIGIEIIRIRILGIGMIIIGIGTGIIRIEIRINGIGM